MPCYPPPPPAPPRQMQLLQTMEDDALDDSGIAETASASTASASGLPDKERAAGQSRNRIAARLSYGCNRRIIAGA